MSARRKAKAPALPATPAPSAKSEEVTREGGPAAAEPRQKGVCAPCISMPSGPAELVLHIHPRTVPAAALPFPVTFGLGGMGLVLFLILAATGILLLFRYVPKPADAHASVLFMRDQIPFGRLIRNLHHWSGNALVMVAGLHMLRVFAAGAIGGPRRLNWYVGLGLLSLVLAANFTGYLLPWDQLAFWAVTICTSMAEYMPLAGRALKLLLRGGEEVGAATLMNFYVLHGFVVPIAFCGLLPFHFWRVRRAGGVAFPGVLVNPRPARLPVIPELVTREASVALMLMAALLAFSLVRDAPLGAVANPGLSPNPARAPWYFAGLQELLVYLHPFYAVVAVPMLAVLALAVFPFIARDPATVGVPFGSVAGRRLAALAAAAALAITPCLILADEHFRTAGRSAATGAGGMPGFATVLALLAVFYAGMRKWGRGSAAEATQALVVFCLTAFAVCTVVGVWFRGPGMALVWP